MFRLVLRNLRQRPLRFILTGLAITFGVSAVTAVFIFTDGLRDTFDELAGNIESGYDVAVQNELPFGDGTEIATVPVELVDILAGVEGVNSVQPRILNGSTVVIDSEGEPVLRTGPPLGVSWEYDTPTPRLFIQEGSAPVGPGEFVIDVDGLLAGDLQVGESYRIAVPSGSVEYELVGTFNFADAEQNQSVGAVITAFAPDVALELLNGGEGYTDITLTSDDPEALVERLGPILSESGETLVARPREELVADRQGDFGQILDIFRTVLLVFAVIILLVSAFLIFNVFNITLGQRIKELGLLRSIGALGSQVTNMMMSEALMLGVVATVLGIPAGWALASGLRALLALFGFPGDTGLPINPLTIALAILVGVVVTMLAAISPSIRARRVSPMAALSENVTTSSLDTEPAPPQGIMAILLGCGLTVLAFLFSGWAPRLLLPVAAGVLLYIGLRLVGSFLGSLAPFVLLLYGLALLTVVRFGSFGLGETFGLLGAGAALTILGVSQVSPVFGAQASRILGAKPSAIIIGLLGVIAALIALGAAGFSISKAITDNPAWAAILLIVPLLGLLAYGLIRTARGAMGLTGRIARENAARNPQRTATTATALMIGLALVTAVTVIGDSIKTSVSDALGSSITADWLVQGPQAGPQGLPFSTDVRERIEALPEIESAVGSRFSFFGFAAVQGDDLEAADLQARIPDLFGALADEDELAVDQIVAEIGADSIRVEPVVSTDWSLIDDHINPKFIERDLSLHSDGNGIWLEDSVAADRGLVMGDTFLAVFLDGAVEELTVAGIYSDGFVFGERVIDKELWERHLDDQTEFFLTVLTADGVTEEDARAAMNDEIGVDYPIIEVSDRSEFAAEQEAQINQTLATVNVLLLLSAAIAVLGIAIALALAVFERTREIGLLRAVGMTREQTRWMIRWEGVIIAAFGGILGVILGVGLGVLATAKMPEFLVNTTTIPYGQLIIYVIAAAITGLLAGLLPAWLAGRMNVLDSISSGD